MRFALELGHRVVKCGHAAAHVRAARDWIGDHQAAGTWVVKTVATTLPIAICASRLEGAKMSGLGRQGGPLQHGSSGPSRNSCASPTARRIANG